MQSQLPASIATALGQQFDREFAGSAPPARGSRNAHAAPVYLRDVAHGQAFILDSDPRLLYVRLQLADGSHTPHALPVVVIAVLDAAAPESSGSVHVLEPLRTVRLVDVVRPIQVRAR
jgi:hypothetical protein